MTVNVDLIFISRINKFKILVLFKKSVRQNRSLSQMIVTAERPNYDAQYSNKSGERKTKG